MDKIQELIKTLKSGRWEEGEAFFMEILDEGLQTIDPVKEAAQEMHRRGQQQRAIELLNLTAMACSEKANTSLWLDTLRLLAEYSPLQKGLISEYSKAFLKKYGEKRPYLANWVEKITSEKGLSITKLIKTLDKLIVFEEGTIVKHKSGWGMGKVLSVDEQKMCMIVDLQEKHNHQINVLAAIDCLVPVSAENFEALIVFDLPRLKKEAEEDPIKLIKRVLHFSSEATTSKELKQLLCPTIVTKDDWAKWWAKARKLMMADPFIEISSETHSKYRLREEKIEWEDEVSTAFEKSSILERPELVLDYLKNFNEQNQEHKRKLDIFSNNLAKLCTQHLAQQNPWHALENYLVLQECVKKGATITEKIPELSEILSGNPLEIYNHLRIPALSQQTLELLLQRMPDWEKHVIHIFERTSDLGRDALMKYLNKEKLLGKYFEQLCYKVISSPLSFPDALVWVAKQILHDKVLSLEKTPTVIEIFLTLLYTGTTLKSLRQTEAVKKINKLFSFAVVKKICNIIDKTQAAEIFRLAGESAWISSSFKQSLRDHIQEKFQDLFSQMQPIYTTEAGLQKYEKELQELIQVKIAENSKALEHALSFGDISENAELDAAREEQFQLMHKAEKMRNDIQRAVVINMDEVKTDRVSVGTKVKLTNDKNEEATYSILGPWDGNVSEGIISFMTPMAEAMLGASIGSTIELNKKQYKVVEISKYKPS